MRNFRNVTVHSAIIKIAYTVSNAFRRVPVIDGGLGLCPNLNQ